MSEFKLLFLVLNEALERDLLRRYWWYRPSTDQVQNQVQTKSEAIKP